MYNLGQEGRQTQDIHYFHPMDIKTKICELWKAGKGKRIALKQQQFRLSALDMTMIIFQYKTCIDIGIRYIIHYRNKAILSILKTLSNNIIWCFYVFVLRETEKNNTLLAFTPLSFTGYLHHIPFTYFFFRFMNNYLFIQKMFHVFALVCTLFYIYGAPLEKNSTGDT